MFKLIIRALMITLFIIDRDHLQRIFCTNKIGVKLSIYDMYNNVRLCTTMYNTIRVIHRSRNIR